MLQQFHHASTYRAHVTFVSVTSNTRSSVSCMQSPLTSSQTEPCSNVKHKSSTASWNGDRTVQTTNRTVFEQRSTLISATSVQWRHSVTNIQMI